MDFLSPAAPRQQLLLRGGGHDAQQEMQQYQQLRQLQQQAYRRADNYVIFVTLFGTFCILAGIFYCTLFRHRLFLKVSPLQQQQENDDNEADAETEEDPESEEEKEQRLKDQLQAFQIHLKSTTFVVTKNDLVAAAEEDLEAPPKAASEKRHQHTKQSSFLRNVDLDTNDEEGNVNMSISNEDYDELNTGTMLRLPLSANQKNNSNGTSDSAEEEQRCVPALCAICLTGYDADDAVAWSAAELSCCHAFHSDCIVNCYAYQQQQQQHAKKKRIKKTTITLDCPLCRSPFVQFEQAPLTTTTEK